MNCHCHSKDRVGASIFLATFVVSGCFCSGCYDGGRLVDLARAESLRSMYVEIDLGEYRISLPRDQTTAAATEIWFHIFGNALRHRVPDILQQLETDRYRLRYATITAVRQAGPLEFSEPNLDKLKSRIAGVINDILNDAPIESIGFTDLRLLYR